MQYNEWKTCIVLRHTQDKVIYLSPGNRKGGRLIVIKLHEIPPKMAKHTQSLLPHLCQCWINGLQLQIFHFQWRTIKQSSPNSATLNPGYNSPKDKIHKNTQTSGVSGVWCIYILYIICISQELGVHHDPLMSFLMAGMCDCGDGVVSAR